MLLWFLQHHNEILPDDWRVNTLHKWPTKGLSQLSREGTTENQSNDPRETLSAWGVVWNVLGFGDARSLGSKDSSEEGRCRPPATNPAESSGEKRASLPRPRSARSPRSCATCASRIRPCNWIMRATSTPAAATGLTIDEREELRCHAVRRILLQEREVLKRGDCLTTPSPSRVSTP